MKSSKRVSALVKLTLGVAATLAGFVPAHAQKFPERPVRILVPLAAGGSVDTVARSLSQGLSDSFGQSVIVDNRPGAGSQVALEILAGADPSGHTLVMISATSVVHPLLYKSRFDVVRDFSPVLQVTQQGYNMVVNPAVPAKTPLELVAHLKANPGKLNYSSSGIGSLIHMSGELFKIATGTQMTHVPYKGMGAAYADLIGGQVQVGFPTIISSVPHVRAGRLRSLAVTPGKRVPALPNVPTFAEAGIKGVVVTNWYGIIAPKKTPKPVIDRIAADAGKAMQDPEMVKRLIADGSEAMVGTPQQFGELIQSETKLWAGVIKKAGIKGEGD
jgi:tripartite-type tricarboxylate transporter receptor subunit TctC